VSASIVATAPGKVVLSGEYAVLDGAPAICMAINRRARATISHRGDSTSHVESMGYACERGEFKSTDNGIRWQVGQESFTVIDTVWRAANVGKGAGRDIHLNTTSFIDSPTYQKIGVGSSAAITVALTAAIKGCADVATIGMLAHQAHKELQGGVGSGVDVASSLYGGLIEYRIEGAAVKALSWPTGLSYRLIWTGTPASTQDKLTHLNAGVSEPSRVRLVGASEVMAGHWRSGDPVRVLDGYRDYCEQLREFSSDHKLGIFDMGHNELWREAKGRNLTYKPCGAGGGDVGIVLGLDDAELDAFGRALATNFKMLDCELSDAGVRIEA
jgi:phosphomevalonate kinase